MLILINILILDLVLDWFYDHFFFVNFDFEFGKNAINLVVDMVKMLLFLVQAIVYQHILIVVKKIFHFLLKDKHKDQVILQQQYITSKEIVCIAVEATVFLFFKVVKLHQTKAKDLEMKPYPLYLDKISKNFAVDNLKKIEWMCI